MRLEIWEDLEQILHKVNLFRPYTRFHTQSMIILIHNSKLLRIQKISEEQSTTGIP